MTSGVLSGRGKRLQARKVANHETVGGAGDKALTFEATHDSNGCLRADTDHVGHVLPGQSDVQANALGIFHAVSSGKAGQERRKALLGAIQCQKLGFFLRFMQSGAQILDDLHRGIRVPSQHVEIGFLAQPQNADISHRLSGPGMAGTFKGRGVAAKQIARHQHLDGTFFPIGRGLHALHCSFLYDVKVFGGVALTEDHVVLPIMGFRELLKHALTV